MSSHRAPLIPFLHYRDARAGLEWLESVLGFRRHFVVDGEDGAVAHAELALGSSVLMLGSAHESDLGMRAPRDVGGVTQGVYIVVDDIDALWNRVQKAECEIVQPLHDTEYGSREISLRDPEGHLWSVGTYDPWSSSGSDA